MFSILTALKPQKTQLVSKTLELPCRCHLKSSKENPACIWKVICLDSFVHIPHLNVWNNSTQEILNMRFLFFLLGFDPVTPQSIQIAL